VSAKPNGLLTWNINEISNALKIGPDDVREYFTDERRVMEATTMTQPTSKPYTVTPDFSAGIV
jgi:hypothetical protein